MSATEEPDSGSEEGRGPVTFIDLLSSDEQFSEYLHIVQRLRMVIPLNRIRNATMLVPSNDAVKKYRKEHEHDPDVVNGVYGGVTEQQGWYHLVADGIIDNETLFSKTMLWESYGYSSGDKTAPTLDSSRHGMMLKTRVGNGTEQVTANGVPVLTHGFPCEAGNVFLIDGVLTIPPTILDILHQKSPGSTYDSREYGFVEKLLDAAGWHDVIDVAKGDSEVAGMHTLWAFSNSAFSAGFNFAERAYLLHGPTFAADDQSLLDEAISDTQAVAARYISAGSVSIARLGEGTHKGIVHGVEQVHRPEGLVFTPKKMLVGLNATMFIRLLKDTGLSEYIDGSRPANKLTILAPTNRAMEDAFGYDLGDGDDDDDESARVLLEAGISRLSPYFDNLDRSSFVDALRTFQIATSPRERQRDWARYHIVDGQYQVDDLAKNPLLRTMLSPESTGGKPQVVKAHVDQAHGALSKHISFNSADNILPEPVIVDNTTIYLLSSPMPTPPSLVNALISNLDLSLFVAAMGASNIVDQMQQEAGVTVLAPVADSFTSLGLVWSYLSLSGDAAARGDLSRLIKAHILERPVYSDEIPLHTDDSADTLVVETLNGNKVGLYRTRGGMYAVVEQDELPGPVDESGLQGHSKPSQMVSSSGSNNLKISEPDILLRTGVAHILEDGIILPSNVEITLSKLLQGMKAHIFEDLLERLNLTYVLKDPRASKDVSKQYGKSTSKRRQQRVSIRTDIARSGSSKGNGVDEGEEDPVERAVGYSLLVPSDKAWRENAAYRELVRRDHDEARIFDEDDDGSNPWRNSTTTDIMRYLDMLVRLHIIPIFDDSPQLAEAGRRLPAKRLRLVDYKTYPTLLENVNLKAHEFASNRFSVQLDDMPFYQSPGRTPFISYAVVLRSGIARTGAVFELDAALRLPPDNSKGPGGWKQFAWSAAVWLTGIGMGSGLLGVSGYWVRQWWTRSDYESL
ncbi:hypothetical protein IWW48_001056 [Coemansia sp. RSA 1200]|nr:hypothetical protein IWW48_001056 [Coemansia sp. RSA 1200]